MGSSADFSLVPREGGLTLNTGCIPVLGQHLGCTGTCPSRPHYTLWLDIYDCITISDTKWGVLICHRGMIRVPIAMKNGALTTILVGHVPNTGGTTETPTSNNLPQGESRPHHFGLTWHSTLFYGYWVLDSQEQGEKVIFISSLGSYLIVSACNLDPKRGGSNCLKHLEGAGSAIPRSVVQVPQGFMQSLHPLLQGPRIYLQSSLKDAIITFSEACSRWIIWQMKLPFNVVLFHPKL